MSGRASISRVNRLPVPSPRLASVARRERASVAGPSVAYLPPRALPIPRPGIKTRAAPAIGRVTNPRANLQRSCQSSSGLNPLGERKLSPKSSITIWRRGGPPGLASFPPRVGPS